MSSEVHEPEAPGSFQPPPRDADKGRMRLRLVLVLILLAVAAVPAAGAATPAVDVMIAMDTTGSMGPSIRQAQRDARGLVAAVKRSAPSARFAVVQFKDRGDSPEYELLQTMTANAGAIEAALGRLNAGGGGDNPEGLNVIFRNSWADTRTGWRSAARKLVVLISDAEPHGAATSRFGGCLDGSADPHELSSARELAAMKREGRTLLLVRQASSATVALQCYQSLAAAAYRAGAARDGGNDLVGTIQALIARVVADAPRTTPAPKPKPTTKPAQKPTGTKTDRDPPEVQALASSGYGGTTIQLQYRVKDASGRSSERVTVYDGSRVLTKSGWVAFGPATGAIYYFGFPTTSSLAGTFRWCVQARDPFGNVSKWSCATVTVT